MATLKLNGRPANEKEEDEIVEIIKQYIKATRKERRSEIRDFLDEMDLDCKLVSVGHGSVIFSFWCRTEQAQLRIMLWVDNGRLKSLIEALVNKLLRDKFGTVCVAVLRIKRFTRECKFMINCLGYTSL